ncbi:aminotransferase [Amphibacillus marinus]|uniref:Aminotransferase n=1 Tax=Amphibacillus marinus TaxID=872970 RepID=A0A1H8I9T1_9BACI|nr:aminotransferase class I/II-fold pyridoxal phosphate-dependent enzyme [Amphibacillus marinus]SEN65560.1 aminotransferase [Amphibacillus marinus]
MTKSINNQVEQIEISGIRKFFNLVSERKDVISLTIGQPDFPTPTVVKEAAILAVEENKTSYTANAGLPELRHAVAQYMNESYQTSIQGEQVIITVGASQAIDVVCRSLLNTGDEVILPDPVYPGYEPLIKLAGATAVHVNTQQADFKLTASLLERAITPQTKCVILPYPSNPTGVSLDEEECHKIAELVHKHNLFLITDEIYSALSYEKPHYSMARISKIKDQLIVINGLSKSHAMTGWRIGFLITPQWLTPHCIKVLQYNVSCASSISQYAALAAVTKAQAAPIEMKQAYMTRRDFVYKKLINMGIEVIKPDGAFYFMVRIKSSKSSLELALDLVERVGLALVPGDAFGEAGQGYLRLSYAYSLDTLAEGLSRLEAYLRLQK